LEITPVESAVVVPLVTAVPIWCHPPASAAQRNTHAFLMRRL
jgi:hypothetical protein